MLYSNRAFLRGVGRCDKIDVMAPESLRRAKRMKNGSLQSTAPQPRRPCIHSLLRPSARSRQMTKAFVVGLSPADGARGDCPCYRFGRAISFAWLPAPAADVDRKDD
ncbi:hypothetical protein MTO96_047802 [Rhipicephalus appendiculatus]